MKLSSITFFLTLITSILPLIRSQKPTPSSDTNEYYEICDKPFKCGSVENLTYPFYDGLTRPDYCGYPGFQLNCNKNLPEMWVTSSDKYYVLGMKPDQPIMTVAREEYYDGNYCPQRLFNTSINYTLFSYAPMNVNITLYYDCSEKLETMYPFYCSNGTSAGYFTANSSSGDVDTCKSNIFVPIFDYNSAAARLTDQNNLLTTLQNGFELEWMANYSSCDECRGTGGACGYNTSTSKFICHCPYQSHGNRCGGKSDSKKAVVIGVVIGGVSLLATLLVCSSLFIVRRRNRLLSHAQSKDLGPDTPTTGLPSSNGFRSTPGFTTSPSTNLSQSFLSYPSSKSVFESGSSYFGVKVFSYAELKEATDNFHESRELGDGGFGTVYYGKLQDGRLVAVKRLYESSCKRMGQFTTEIEILARLRHDNLVTLHGCTSKRSRELLLVYEYVPNGTVADHLHGKLAKSNKLTWSVRFNIAVKTANALAFLHESDVIHRDVKTTNILLDDNFQVKVADFGLSRLFPTDVTHVSTAPQGTPGYVDPEYYQCYHLTEKSDVFSFGVVLIELISSKPAVDITRHRHDINLSNMAVDRIKKNALQELVDPKLGFDEDYAVQKMVKLVADLAFRCLQKERETRPSMGEVLELLRGIQKEMVNGQKQVVLDIQEIDDDVGLLKNDPPPLSPET